jgi:hypothetical protein
MAGRSNPFIEYGLANFEQFRKLPFVELPLHTHLKNRIRGVMGNWENKILGSGDWIYLVGGRGEGKTTTLFCLADFVRNELNYGAEVISALPEDELEYATYTGATPPNLNKPFYLFIDFPEKVEHQKLLRFLSFVESCMRSGKYYEKTKFVLAMNQDHLVKCKTLNGNLIGKFVDYLLIPLTEAQAYVLIEARLELVNMSLTQFADTETLSKIFRMSRGVPRNLMSYCSKIYSDGIFPAKLINTSPETFIPLFERIIQEHEPKANERQHLQKVLEIMRFLPEYKCDSKMMLADLIGERLNRGRTTCLKWINKLIYMGILYEENGGRNNSQKYIMLGNDKCE